MNSPPGSPESHNFLGLGIRGHAVDIHGLLQLKRNARVTGWLSLRKSVDVDRKAAARQNCFFQPCIRARLQKSRSSQSGSCDAPHSHSATLCVRLEALLYRLWEMGMAESKILVGNDMHPSSRETHIKVPCRALVCFALL